MVIQSLISMVAVLCCAVALTSTLRAPGHVASGLLAVFILFNPMQPQSKLEPQSHSGFVGFGSTALLEPSVYLTQEGDWLVFLANKVLPLQGREGRQVPRCWTHTRVSKQLATCHALGPANALAFGRGGCPGILLVRLVPCPHPARAMWHSLRLH